MITVITTLHKKEDAIRIGKGLLEKRLIACYNLWPIESAYRWKGEIEEEPDIFSLQPGQTVPAFDKWVTDETTESR
jgi:uncharacterized protein involved in tolerance to divalent cations